MQQDIKKAVERQRNALSITAVASEPTPLALLLVYPSRGFLVDQKARLSGQGNPPIN
jgi:hypothetical protein